MRRRSFSPIPALALFAAVPVAAWAQSPLDMPIQIRGGAMILDLHTELRVDSRKLHGSDIDLEDDLGVTRTPAIPFGEFQIGNRFRILVAFFESIRRGKEDAGQSLRFNGEVMALPGDSLNARSELRDGDLIFGTRLYGSVGFRIDILLGGKYLHIANRISNEEHPLPPGVTRRSSTDTLDFGSMYGGLGGFLTITSRLSIQARILFSRYTANLFQVERFNYTDFAFGVTYVLFDWLSLQAEYRLLDLDVVDERGGTRTAYHTVGNGIGIGGLIAF